MAGEPWVKREDETGKAYRAFCVYRDMGDERKLESVTSNIYFNGKDSAEVGAPFRAKHRQVEKWSSANEWVKRVDLYDEYILEKAREDDEEGRIKAIRRQKAIADAILLKIYKHVMSDEFDPSQMKDRDLITLLEKSVNIERLVFGEATEQGKTQVEVLDKNDLKKQLADKLLRRITANKPAELPGTPEQ